MGALPKRKISKHRKGKRRLDITRKFSKKVESLKSQQQRLNSKDQA